MKCWIQFYVSNNEATYFTVFRCKKTLAKRSLYRISVESRITLQFFLYDYEFF